MKKEVGVVFPRHIAEDIENLLRWYQQNKHLLGRTMEEPEPLMGAPDVYIAISTNGISAMTAEAGTGTDSSMGRAIDKDDCRLFRIDDDDPNIDIDPLGFTKPVYNPSTVAIAANVPFLAVRDKPGKYVAVTLGGGDSSFLARLTGKTYTSGQYIAYSWVRLLDSNLPKPLTWTSQPTSGGPGNNPAYEVNNIDLPVTAAMPGTGSGTGTDTLQDDGPTIVRMRLGAGAYYVFESEPRWEFVRKVGGPDANGYYSGSLQRYDQISRGFVDVETVLIIDANAP